ncbi:hypothetical protein P8452_69947 [Trifolium repens]|nr:hypothetical protein P8452_69947 [Trifolium repens]
MSSSEPDYFIVQPQHTRPHCNSSIHPHCPYPMLCVLLQVLFCRTFPHLCLTMHDLRIPREGTLLGEELQLIIDHLRISRV